MPSPRGTKMSPRRSPKQGDENLKPVSFFDALREVGKGKTITRLSWNDPNNYVYLKNDTVHIVFPGDTEEHWWILGTEDMEAEDWVVL